MTASIWMAFPPEVHSALLSSGPGPGSLLAAAGAWNSLSTEYASVAEELSALVASVQAGAWEGPSAESYVAANVPFVAWLMQASANSAAAAAQHETVAGAYTAALAAMPTLAELAANHAIHAVLVATNFFGINTIPIALNEVDYVRMWIQAATTMATYQAVSTTAVASTPQTAPAPQIQKSSAPTQNAGNPFPDPRVDNPLDDFIASILKNFGINWNPAQGTVNGMTYDTYTNPGQPIYWVVRSLELFEDFQQFGVYLTQNPALAFQYLVALESFDWPTHIAQIAGWLPSQPALIAAAALIMVAPFGAVGGFAGLAGLAALPQPTVAPVPAPVAAAPPLLPAVAMAPTVAGAAAAAAPAPAPAPTTAPGTSTAASSAPPTPPPAATTSATFVPPYVVGPPGIGARSGMSTSASSSAKKKAPEPDSAAAAAAAAAREQARARRRRRANQRGRGDAFMDMNVDVNPDWGPPEQEPVGSTAASNTGAGPLGFAGTVHKDRVAEAVGLTTLASDEFGEGPRMPMVPGSWSTDPEASNGQGNEENT
jgi:PPE-repeat protein